MYAVLALVIVVSRRRRQNQHVKKVNAGDPWDDKRHFFNQTADDFTKKHLTKDNTDEEFDQAAVTNPVYEPSCAQTENPSYLVCYSIQP